MVLVQMKAADPKPASITPQLQARSTTTSSSSTSFSSSGFGGLFGLFGKKKKQPQQEPLQKLRETLHMLERREKQLEHNIRREAHVAASQASKNDKHGRPTFSLFFIPDSFCVADFALLNSLGALLALKKKKVLETQIENINSARLKIEQQVMALESSSINTQGTHTLKANIPSIDVDSLDDKMSIVAQAIVSENQFLWQLT